MINSSPYPKINFTQSGCLHSDGTFLINISQTHDYYFEVLLKKVTQQQKSEDATISSVITRSRFIPDLIISIDLGINPATSVGSCLKPFISSWPSPVSSSVV